jgi:DNA-binding response OmpR family regulator
MGKANVIVINNSSSMRRFIVDALEKNDYCVVSEISNTDEAQEVVFSYTFDILILDLVLPKYSGLDFFKRLKTKDEWEIPVIMTTPINIESIVLDILGNGVRDILVWPFDEQELIKSLEHVWPKKF